MPEWLFAGFVSLGGIALTTGGLVVGAVVSAKTTRTTATQQAAASVAVAAKTSEQIFIDNLQDELARYREATDQRLDKLEAENTAYRAFIFVQRDHMREHGLTPPAWPANLPR